MKNKSSSPKNEPTSEKTEQKRNIDVEVKDNESVRNQKSHNGLTETSVSSSSTGNVDELNSIKTLKKTTKTRQKDIEDLHEKVMDKLNESLIPVLVDAVKNVDLKPVLTTNLTDLFSNLAITEPPQHETTGTLVESVGLRSLHFSPNSNGPQPDMWSLEKYCEGHKKENTFANTNDGIFCARCALKGKKGTKPKFLVDLTNETMTNKKWIEVGPILHNLLEDIEKQTMRLKQAKSILENNYLEWCNENCYKTEFHDEYHKFFKDFENLPRYLDLYLNDRIDVEKAYRKAELLEEEYDRNVK